MRSPKLLILSKWPVLPIFDLVGPYLSGAAGTAKVWFLPPKLRHPRTLMRPSQAGSCTLMSSPGVMLVQLQPAFSSLSPHSSPLCPHLDPTPVIGGLLARTDPASFVTAPGPYLGLRPSF